MPEIFGFDVFSPKEIAARVETIGMAKARLPDHLFYYVAHMLCWSPPCLSNSPSIPR